MKAWFKDIDIEVQFPSVRQGPWEIPEMDVYGNSITDLRSIIHPDGRICWRMKVESSKGHENEREYWWDWEGDSDLALREAIMAAEYAEVSK